MQNFRDVENAEYLHFWALSSFEAVTDVIYLIGVCKGLLPLESIVLVRIFEDNLGAVCIANLGNFTKKSKHIEVHYHFVREAVEHEDVQVIKVDSSENLADIFTKSLSKPVFITLKKLLCVLYLWKLGEGVR